MTEQKRNQLDDLGFPGLTEEEEKILAEEQGIELEPAAPEPPPVEEPPDETPQVEEPGDPPPAAAEVEPEPELELTSEMYKELQEKLEETQTQNRALMRDMLKERERRQTAMLGNVPQQQPQQQTPGQIPVPYQPPAAPQRIPVEMDDDGQLTVDPAALQQALRPGQPAAPQIPPQGQAPQPQQPAAGDQQAPWASRYGEYRESLIEVSENKEQIKEAFTELEDAFGWLDQQVARELQAQDLSPFGIGMDGLKSIIMGADLDKKFQAKYGMDWERLIQAVDSPYAIQAVIGDYMKLKETDNTGEVERQERRLKVVKTSRKAPGASRISETGGSRLSSLQGMSAEDVLNLTDEQIAEFDNDLKQQQ